MGYMQKWIFFSSYKNYRYKLRINWKELVANLRKVFEKVKSMLEGCQPPGKVFEKVKATVERLATLGRICTFIEW